MKAITNVNWDRKSDPNASSMHSIASYLAMFTPALPKFFIDKFSQAGDLVYDPFSGRGTVGLKAREMNRRFVGADLNPYAVVLTRSKLATVKKDQLLQQVAQLAQDYQAWMVINNSIYQNKEFRELRYFYSPAVLSQLIFLRTEYGVRWRHFSPCENVIFGFVFGLMHGKMRKDGTSMYFSLDMPNTISMAPNYVYKYAQKHHLKRPTHNIFELIKTRINAKFDEPLMAQSFANDVYEHNALTPDGRIKNNSVDLLITCPPYLKLVSYTSANWLRLWLLGYNRSELKVKIRLNDRIAKKDYHNFILAFLINASSKVKRKGHIALVVGDVHKYKLLDQDFFAKKLSHLYKLRHIYKDEILQSQKMTNMLGVKAGKATKVEWVFLLQKI